MNLHELDETKYDAVLLLCNKNFETLGIQNDLVKYLDANLSKDIKIKILMLPKHIIESSLNLLTDSMLIFWHPELAANNLDLVKRNKNSIVLLKKRTVLIQKSSKYNPINENMAINHDFKICYMSEENDVTNMDWKLVLSEEVFVLTIEKINQIILENKNGK